jgi:hypothetical protein
MACRFKIHSAQGLAMGVLTCIPSWLHMGHARQAKKGRTDLRVARWTVRSKQVYLLIKETKSVRIDIISSADTVVVIGWD